MTFYCENNPIKRLNIFLFLSILITTSCNKADLSDIDYFAFGTAHGECLGNCAVFFKIEAGKLYPDDMLYYSENLNFMNDPLPDARYQLVKKLVDDFPKYLLDNPDKTFGCPDCADQGGIHIQISEKGTLKNWHIDTVVDNQPAEIRGYITKVLSAIEAM